MRVGCIFYEDMHECRPSSLSRSSGSVAVVSSASHCGTGSFGIFRTAGRGNHVIFHRAVGGYIDGKEEKISLFKTISVYLLGY